MIRENTKGVVELQFPEILKQLRQNRNLSQKQLAEAIFISPSAVSQYETGNTHPSHETLERIAKFFNVTTDYLFGNSSNAELEERMNQDYCDGVTVSSFMDRCMSIKGKHRETLLDVVEALELQSQRQNKR